MAENRQDDWLDYWKAQAEAGDPDAQIEPGCEYFRGGSLARDISLPEFWFLAADQEASEAGSYQLLKMYFIARSEKIHQVFR